MNLAEKYKLVQFENGKYGCLDSSRKEFLDFFIGSKVYRHDRTEDIIRDCQSRFLWRAKRLIKRAIKFDIQNNIHSYKEIN